MERIECSISGRVQGVFLRAHIKECADARSLLGFVRNLENGTVQVVAEGNAEVLTAFLADIRRGNSLARIESVDVVWGPARHQYDHFSIHHD